MAPKHLYDLWAMRDIFIFALTPIILLPIPLVIGNKESECTYVLLLMAVYWTTEVVPVAVTGLLPILLFPLFGILPIKEITPLYMKPSIVLFTCGLMIACAVQHWNLHKRIALNMILLFGAAPNRLMLGLMLPTWFLSMWISNTATTAMMTPIVLAILDQLNSPTDDKELQLEICGDQDVDKSQPRNEVVTEEDGGYTTKRTGTSHQNHVQLAKALTLCIAYAANVGGTASMIGTGPNIVLIQYTNELYERIGLVNPLNFGTWFMFGLPVSFVCLIVIWLWMQLYFLRCRGFTKCKDDEYGSKVRHVVTSEIRKLGKITFAEMSVLLFFILTVILWFFRAPKFMSGWSTIFPQPKYIGDACAVILATAMMFVFPSKLPRIFCCQKGNKAYKHTALLNWDIVQHGVPWMLVWLLGGGFALAKGAQCLDLHIHPLYVMFPIALATSFAFMLPVATPPNAIVYSTGRLKLTDMIKAGFCLNLLCLVVLNIGANTWGPAAFNLWQFPPDMALLNSTVYIT